MTMSAAEDRLRLELTAVKEEGITMAAALHTVLCESNDAESCRTAVAALMSTSLGKGYLELHPIRF